VNKVQCEEVDKDRAELSRKLELSNTRTKLKRAEIDLVANKLQREEVDKDRAELSRKLELSNTRTKLKRAEIDLVAEQNVERRTKDGMNECLMQHYAKFHVSVEPLLSRSMNGAKPTSKPQPISSEKEMPTSLAQLNFARSQLSVSSAQSSVKTEPVVNLSSTPCVVSAASSKASSEKVSAVTLPYSVECPAEDNPLYYCLSSCVHPCRFVTNKKSVQNRPRSLKAHKVQI